MPICLGGFVAYFAQTDTRDVTLNDAYCYALGIVFCSLYITATFHPLILCMFQTGSKIRVACGGLIYKKALRILRSSNEDGQSGQIINLLSNDLPKIDDGLTFLYDVWRGPLEAFSFFIVIYMEIGIAALAGILFLISFIPLQGNSRLNEWLSREV